MSAPRLWPWLAAAAIVHGVLLVSFSPRPIPPKITAHVETTSLSFHTGAAPARTASPAPADPSAATGHPESTSQSPAPASSETAAGAEPSPETGAGNDTASAPESSGAAASAVGEYLERLRQAVDGHKNYPYAARTRGQQGTVLLAFRLDGEGDLTEEPRVLSSSGYPRLDAAAVAAVKGSSPFVPPPDAAKPWEFRVPVQFVVR